MSIGYKSILGSNNSGSNTYTAGDGIDITNDVISTKQSEEGDIDEIIGSLPSGGMGVTLVNAFNKSDLYSTDEKMIGQFIDSKPLYQKTVVIEPLTLTAVMTNFTLSSLGIDNIDFVAVANAYLYHAAGYWVSCPFYSSASDFVGVNAFEVASGDIIRVCASEYSSYTKLRATLQYTKTTDSAVSIGTANEYSTDEKIVGTWITGAPIWQKTFVFNNPSTDWGLNAFNITNANMLISVPQVIFNDNNIPYVRNDNGEYENLYVNKDGARIRTNQSITKLTITIQYTKTT